MTRLHVVAPFLAPAGGVVKLMDYTTHALAAGWRVTVWANGAADPDLPLLRTERFSRLPEQAEFADLGRGFVRSPEDVVLFSLPQQYEAIAYVRGTGPAERLIHIVQGVRHANPGWNDGHPFRLLSRPMTRIATNDEVRAAIAPFTHPESRTVVIPLGHPRGYFTHPARPGLHEPLRIAYTTWKSDVGDEVAAALAGDDRFTFRAVREHVDWSVLRDLYHWADVFVGTPLPEEGFYMPAFEAMEAGCLVVVPDAGGNRSFCHFGDNCVEVAHGDVAGYVGALRRVLRSPTDEVARMRQAALDALLPFDLDLERDRFAALLDELNDG